jgi:hypothetical protein
MRPTRPLLSGLESRRHIRQHSWSCSSYWCAVALLPFLPFLPLLSHPKHSQPPLPSQRPHCHHRHYQCPVTCRQKTNYIHYTVLIRYSYVHCVKHFGSSKGSAIESCATVCPRYHTDITVLLFLRAFTFISVAAVIDQTQVTTRNGDSGWQQSHGSTRGGFALIAQWILRKKIVVVLVGLSCGDKERNARG